MVVQDDERKAKLHREICRYLSWDAAVQDSAHAIEDAENEAQREAEAEVALQNEARNEYDRQMRMQSLGFNDSEPMLFQEEFEGIPLKAVVQIPGIDHHLYRWKRKVRGERDPDGYDDAFEDTPSQAIWKKIIEYGKDPADYAPPKPPAPPTLHELFVQAVINLGKYKFTRRELDNIAMELMETPNRDSAHKNVTRWVNEPPFQRIARGHYTITL